MKLAQSSVPSIYIVVLASGRNPATTEDKWFSLKKNCNDFFCKKYRALLLCDEHKLQQRKKEKEEDIYQPYTNVILVWSEAEWKLLFNTIMHRFCALYNSQLLCSNKSWQDLTRKIGKTPWLFCFTQKNPSYIHSVQFYFQLFILHS